MNRRRILSSVHRSLARHDATHTSPSTDMPLSRLSDAQLNQAGAALLPRTAREVCPVCYGTGETLQQVTDALALSAPCAECSGRGYYVEGA